MQWTVREQKLERGKEQARRGVRDIGFPWALQWYNGLYMDLSVRNLRSNPCFGRYFLPDFKKNIQLLGINFSLETYKVLQGYLLIK